MRESDLKVGESYNGGGLTVVVDYLGKTKLMYSHKGAEYIWRIDLFIKEYEPLPKEPKKLGQLYMCTESHRIGLNRTEEGDILILVSGDTLLHSDRWTKVYISDKGEVFKCES